MQTRKEGFKRVNQLLIAAKGRYSPALVPWFKYLRLLLTATLKLKPYSKSGLLRGIDKEIAANKGEDFRMWGLTSCTLTESQAKVFAARPASMSPIILGKGIKKKR